MKINLRPLLDRVIVKRTDTQNKTSGGIIIPDNVREKSFEGEIIAVGSGKILENGEIKPINLKIGDKILFAKYSETEFKYNNENYLIIKEDDILAVIE